ncbi:SMP-30/gluconolactonase/LRE family protein [Bacillus sp. NEB1478]|uniref:SMP-30/gluconolactonase/LRE family protein n=1 Tax=Bacillus sp. NEB1478 TaxID=3073816 RepID=UPI002872B5AE|nr:SMP-30/gluconolactonase/LRE family protein [Bacillus sp. NEB1478]WNB90768.1 SMP-30/gluconolactonase/LRE family protein [Bacillus sp. NEB1478]
MKKEIQLVVDAKATLGEGPCWDRENQLLYWVDIQNKKVCIHNPNTNDNKEIQLDQLVGAAVLRKSGGLILAMEKGFYSLNLKTYSLEQIVDPEGHMLGNRFNDGKVDPKGRFWAGTMSLNEEKEKGSLYCLHTDLTVEKKVSQLTISNGIAWSPDHRYMYLIDTPTRKVTRYQYDNETGNITNPEDVIAFPQGVGNPDGMTIDEDGMLWIAHWGGARVSRWNPETGEQIDEICVPAKNVTSCTFGGESLDELYITTARTGTNDEELVKYPHAGGVFRVKMECIGSCNYYFEG